MNIAITNFQKEFLQHRLSSTDAIVEFLSCEYGFKNSEIASSIETIETMVSQSSIQPRDLNTIEKRVLIDLIEGSVWFVGNSSALSHGEITTQKDAAQKKSIERLVDRLESFGFGKIDVPF